MSSFIEVLGILLIIFILSVLAVVYFPFYLFGAIFKLFVNLGMRKYNPKALEKIDEANSK